MSVEFLKKNFSKRLSWIDEKGFKKGEFGPPAFDEGNLSYSWRVFKRGFSWGKN